MIGFSSKFVFRRFLPVSMSALRRNIGSSVDLSTHNEFGVLARAKAIADLVKEGNILQEIEQLAVDGIGIGGIPTLTAYSDLQVLYWTLYSNGFLLPLQHPLLYKYGFKYDEFLSGAKEGFNQTMACLYSEDFRDFCLR